MERSRSFLHRPSPAPKRQDISRLAHRSHSIADVLHVVESGNVQLVGPDAYLPDPNDSPSRRSPTNQRPQSVDQAALFHASSFVAKTSTFNRAGAEEAHRQALNRNVVLFPKELRGNNRFFTSPELGQKANTLVQYSRRPSSLFSDSITSTARDDLSAIHRIKKYEDIKQRNFQHLSKHHRHSNNNASVLLQPFRPISQGPADFNAPSVSHPQYLVHVPGSEREQMEELEKLGRRVEYGRMVSMFREEILAAKVGKRYAGIEKHPEVESRHSGSHLEVALDWTFCDIDDPLQLMDVLPRDGLEMLEGGCLKRRSQKQAVAAGAITTKPPIAATRSAVVTNKRKSEAPQRELAQIASATVGSDPTNVAASHRSPIWKLKYCFNDDDAEGIIEIQRGIVVVETAGQKYAFDPTKQQTSRDLDAEHESRLSPEKRARLRWLKLSPEEREKERIQRLLSCGRTYQAHHVTLANNALTRVDGLLTNTLATLLRCHITKLDLSFNNIQTIDESFLNANQQAVEERKKATLLDAAAQEEEEIRLAGLSSGGLLSEAQQHKQREMFLQMRRRAIRDLVDVHAAHRLFHSLHTLLLHGNPLRDLDEIWKLEPLRFTLRHLSFHGHPPLDTQIRDPRNRVKLRSMFPLITQLNFTTLLATEDDSPASLVLH